MDFRGPYLQNCIGFDTEAYNYCLLLLRVVSTATTTSSLYAVS